MDATITKRKVSAPYQSNSNKRVAESHFTSHVTRVKAQRNQTDKEKLATRMAEDLRHVVSPVSWPKSCF